MVAVGQPPGKHDVPIQNTAHRVRDGLIGVVALHQHGIDPCDGALLEVAAAFQQLGQLGVDGWGVAAAYRRLTHRQANLPLGHGKPGQRVHHQQHVIPLVPEELRDSGGHGGALLAQHGGLVRGSHHQDRPPHPLRPQILFHEFQHLAAALPHQGDDVDIRLYIFGNHAH